MRWISSLALLASASTLMGAACDSLRLPAPPARHAASAVPDSAHHGGGREAATARRSGPSRPTRRWRAQRFEQIRRGLRRLVVAEETYYAENGVYTEDLSRIGFKPDRDAQFRFLWVSRTGWAASGTHAGVPGQDCVIFVGRGHGAPTTLRDRAVGAGGRAGLRWRPPAAPPAAAAGSRRAPPVAADARRRRPKRRRAGAAIPAARWTRSSRGPDARGSPEPGAVPGHLVRPAGRLLEADRAVRAAVPLAPGREDHHPQRQRRLLVGPCHARVAPGQELRHLARAGLPAAGDRRRRSGCPTEPAVPVCDD